MEDTLREDSAAAKSKRIIVLILVLMEDTLRVLLNTLTFSIVVLIVVLMEDTLRVKDFSIKRPYVS